MPRLIISSITGVAVQTGPHYFRKVSFWAKWGHPPLSFKARIRPTWIIHYRISQGSFTVLNVSPSSTMASKLLLSQLRNITRPTHHRLINPNFIFPLKNQTLIHSRPYSDAPQPPPVGSKPPPTNADSAPTHKKISSSLNQAELAKFSAIAETWYLIWMFKRSDLFVFPFWGVNIYIFLDG